MPASALKKSQWSKAEKQADNSRAPGRQNTFSRAKLEFLDSFKEEFMASNNVGTFYNVVACKFCLQFGYDLNIDENPPLGTDLSMLVPIPIGHLSSELQEVENKKRSEYYQAMRQVSVIMYFIFGANLWL